MKFADPKSNIAFKKIFGNDNKKEILISFLNAVLNLKEEKAIKEVEILDPYQAPRLRYLKETTLDVRAKDHRGISFIVEMQVEKQEYFAKRALYYTSKAYVSQIEKAVDYPRLNQAIFIGILDFSVFQSNNYLSRHLILNTENYQQEFTDFEFNFIELPKFTLTEDDLETVIEKWVYFIKHADNLEVIPGGLKDTPEIVDAFNIADQHNWTKEELEIYDYWQMQEASHQDAMRTARKDGLEEGFKEGEEKGREEGIKEIVLFMHNKGLDTKQISESTGIPEENVTQIIEKRS